MTQFTKNSPFSVAFILIPEFTLISFSSVCESLRVANRISKSQLYRWKLYSVNGKPVKSHNGLECPVDDSFENITNADMIIVCSSFNPQNAITKTLLEALEKLSRKTSYIVGIDTGAYILARANMLNGYSATIHWEYLSNFRQTFTRINVLTHRYVIDNKRITTSGAAASLDMILAFISERNGKLLATGVAEQFDYSPSFQTDRSDNKPLSPIIHPVIENALELMENHLEDNLSTQQIAMSCGVSLRQLERLFKKTLNTTPGRWYRQIRLKNAKVQLKQSYYNIAQIASNNGFESASSFCRAYKAYYQHPPSIDKALK